MARLRLLVILLAIAILVPAASSSAHAVEVVRRDLPDLADLTRGPDGALWVANSSPAEIGRLGSNGRMRWFRRGLEGVSELDSLISVGRDLWFVGSGVVGRMSLDGRMRLWRDGLEQNFGSPGDLTAAPDGRVWFAQGGQLGRIDGDTMTLLEPPDGLTGDLVYGFDNRLWLTLNGLSPVRVDPDGSPGPDSGIYDSVRKLTSAHGRIYAAIDGNVRVIGPQGPPRTVTLDVAGGRVTDIVAGLDGRMWAALPDSHELASFAPDGTGVRRYGPFRDLGFSPDPHLAFGPQRSIWFLDGEGGLGRMTLRARDCVVPRLRALDIRAARRSARRGGCTLRTRGSGRFVRAETPAPGRLLTQGSSITVSLGRRPAAQCTPPPGTAVVAHSPQAVLIGRTAPLAAPRWWGCLRAHPRLVPLWDINVEGSSSSSLDYLRAAGTFVSARLAVYYDLGSVRELVIQETLMVWDLATGAHRELPVNQVLNSSEVQVHSVALGPQGELLWLSHVAGSSAETLTFSDSDGSSQVLARDYPLGAMRDLRVTRDAATWTVWGLARTLPLSR